MVATPDEKRKAADLEKDKATLTRLYKNNLSTNTMYGGDPTDPNSYIPYAPTAEQVASDPSLANVLPSSSYLNPRQQTPAVIARANQIAEIRNDAPAYMKANSTTLANEQSLLDKGKTMMGRLFDYRDEPDASLFGVDLGAVESAWDGFLRHFTGAYDLLNVGFGGLISAAPGGVRTLEFSELSGGKNVGQVLSGEMEPGSAPSPGQIAITSVGIEAKRIREGGARLSDILLLNPATAPFILAGLKAETSPIQADNFDIMNKEQRDKAFSNGWEQWMSGVTDFGLAFADPLIGAGVGVKIARKGLLTSFGTAAEAQMTKAVTDDVVQSVLGVQGVTQSIDEIIESVAAKGGPSTTVPSDPTSVVEAAGPKGLKRMLQEPELVDYIPKVTTATPMPKSDNPYMALMYKLAQYGDDGQKVMTPTDIENVKELKYVTNRATAVDLLYRARNILEVSLVIQSMKNTPGAVERLNKLAPALAEATFSAKQDQIQALIQSTEKVKLKEVADQYSAKAQIYTDQIADLKITLDRIAPNGVVTGLSARTQELWANTAKRIDVLEQSRLEVQELHRIATGQKKLSKLDPTSPFFNIDEAKRIVTDLEDSNDLVSRLLRKEIQDELTVSRLDMTLKSNAYSRAVARHRLKSGKAASEFAKEGTSIFPKTRQIMENGIPNPVRSGWFAPSEFAGTGTGRLRRNARVWRYAGALNPSGYIGLKGTATVGSEKEFQAALDLDLYKGQGRNMGTKADGTPDIVGGIANRERYVAKFYNALNNPNVDTAKVLWEIEEEIAEDFARAYQMPVEDMKKMLNEANRRRSADLKLIREEGYFLDADGTRNYVPWLETHLAHGTYMQNFREWERLLMKSEARDGGKSLRASFDVPVELASSAYATFNNIWRPATLLRLSYTQRNVFEGMVRAMAYQASLAPLSWPVRATTHGVANAVRKRSVNKEVSKVYERISGTETGVRLSKLDEMRDAHYYYDTAMDITDESGNVIAKVMNMKTPDGSYKRTRLSPEKWEADRQKVADDYVATMESLDGIADDFTKSIKGTKFQKWRDKEVKALEQSLAELAAFRNIINQEINEVTAGKSAQAIFDEPALMDKLAELNAHTIIQSGKLHALQYRPTEAIALYRGFAGRQKRIGSGTSLGPDGTYYGDAFSDSLEQINRDLLSSDTTRKSILGVQSDVFASIFKDMVYRDNTPVAWGPKPAQEKQFIDALAGAIEDASSSRIVHVLIENGMDVDRTVDWMLSGSKEADVFTTRIMSYFADPSVSLEDVAKTENFGATVGNRLVPFATQEVSPSGRKSFAFDRDRVTAYVQLAESNVRYNMQNNQALFEILERRIADKTGAQSIDEVGAISGRPATGASVVTEDELRAVIQQMDAPTRNTLNPIIGSEAIHIGTSGFSKIWANFTNKAFRLLGTVPEDAIVRGPFYNSRFKATRNQLIEEYWQSTKGMTGREVKKAKAARKPDGSSEGGTISHDEFKIPVDELSRIEVLSHRRALADTKEWMFTIDQQTNLGKYGEWLFPFISAQQNSVVTIGKLLYKEPWLAPMVTDLWRAPSRLGIEDEEGNIKLPMPVSWVQSFLDDHPEIPFIGGVIDSKDIITIPKNGLNVWMPETGFGVIPTPVPFVEIGASELMKMNAFPVETPQILKTVLGQETGDQVYQLVKDYMFGEEDTVSSKFLSYDKVLPAYAQKIVNGMDELSTQYGYQYALQMATQQMRYKAGERDDRPEPDEIAKRTTNQFWFYALGNWGLPTPLTPYPILTRPNVTKQPAALLMEEYDRLRNTNMLEANLAMDRQYGDFGLEAALSKVSLNAGGANANAATVSDIQTFDPLIREIVPQIGKNNYNVLGILVNNRGDQTEYEDAAYNWQKSKVIPGTSTNFRENLSPEEALSERQRVVGWTRYRAFMDQLGARLHAAGYDSYEVSGAEAFKAAKQTFVNEAINNPELAGWTVDYQDIGGNRVASAVRTLQTATTSPLFRSEMMKSGKSSVLGCMDEYVQQRETLVGLLKESGRGIDWEGNINLKRAWAKIRKDLEDAHPRWAEISNLYLAGDDNPQPVGTFEYPDSSIPMQGAM
jgi:hypothetical protein